MGLLWGESGVTLRVTWVFFWEYPRVTLRVPWGRFEGTLGSLWEYSRITLKVLWGNFLGYTGGHFGTLLDLFEGTIGVYCQLFVTLTIEPGRSYRLYLSLVFYKVSFSLS